MATDWARVDLPAMTEERVNTLGPANDAVNNSARHETAFTVSIEP